jgi:membrane-associated phospholipid phosphatase
LIPASLAYPAPNDLGIWDGLFRFADRLNLDYNLVPSLHIALSMVCIEMYAGHATSLGKVLLRGWGLLIAASTVLTHQHHLLDGLTGGLLAILVVRRLRFTPISSAEGDACCALSEGEGH